MQIQRTPPSKFFGIALVLFFSLLFSVVATTVTTDKGTYAPGETVTISGTCTTANVAVGIRALTGGENVWFDQVTADASKSFTSQFLPSEKGKYTITAACQDETGSSVDFTVETTVTTPGTPETPTNGGGGPSGSGFSCSPARWEYSDWSRCGPDLKQTRTAVDLSKPTCPNRKPDAKDLVRDCSPCQESWTCGVWSGCINGVQTRECFDDTQCGTFATQPDLSRSCELALPPEQPPSKPFLPQLTQKAGSFWDKYMYWIIGVPLGLLILVLLIILIRLLLRKKLFYNPEEVRVWAKRERAAGTSLDDVKKIIEQYTHWKRDKIDLTISGVK